MRMRHRSRRADFDGTWVVFSSRARRGGVAFRLREKPPVLRAGLTGGGWCAIGFTHFGAFDLSELRELRGD